MTERERYTEDELEQISDAIWGAGRYRPRSGPLDTPCPRCGADTTVYVSEDMGSRPITIRASCSTCGATGSGRATKAERRQLTDEELREILALHVRGEDQVCPVCQAPLQVEKIFIAGSGGPKPYKVTCLRCRSWGQMKWPPAQRDNG